MAATAAPPGGSGSSGGGSVGGGDGIGGHSLSGKADGFLEARAARAFADALVRSPAKSSHRLTCSLGGCDLDDEVWEVRFNFFGCDNLERILGESDITYLNLLALIEQEGYGLLDSMYFVKEKGTGMAGMELIDGTAKVQHLLKIFARTKCIEITVVKGRTGLPPDFNREIVEDQIPISEIGLPIVYCVDDGGVLFPRQDTFDDSEMLYMFTQQSTNISTDKEKQIVHTEDGEGDYLLSQLSTEENEAGIKRKIFDTVEEEESDLFCVSDGEEEDVEEGLFSVSDGEEDVCEIVPDPVKKKKKQRFKGPTDRSHCSQISTTLDDFLPSDDDDSDADFADDGAEVLSWVLPKGRKSRAKKLKPRVWYDENMQHPKEGLCLQMCFTDVYQFRRALQAMHIGQLRNFRFHRNDKDRVIAVCKEKEALGCPFFMTGSNIRGEKTFCLRKMHMEHTCGTSGENCKVTAAWVAQVVEQSIRIDPTTGIDTIIESTKEKYGVAIPKVMAYRARKKALEAVLGDQVKQYTRIRDYLQIVLDTNPGSRCIITTRTIVEHPSENPRFHRMFVCLNASREGFLNGCRPFIGLDGCFVKVNTGQQILTATGRDGNNNIFPIAFGLAEKEDTASWGWFLTQLKIAIGGEEGKFGRYTIISDRQKGLLNAINQIFPSCPQRYCLRHIYSNFQIAGYRGEELKK